MRTTLKEVRIGDLEGAVASLQSLVNLAPDEPSYKKLLAVARRQLEKQGWYRFQEQFYVPGDGPQPGASEANKAQPAMPKDVKDVKPTTLDELVLLRLKLATWLAPHARGSEPARD